MDDIRDQFHETTNEFIARRIFEALELPPRQVIRSIEKFALLHGLYEELETLRECDYGGKPFSDFTDEELLEVWTYIRSWSQLCEAEDAVKITATRK